MSAAHAQLLTHFLLPSFIARPILVCADRAATNFYPGTIIWARDPNSTFFAPQWLLPSVLGSRASVHEHQFARIATEIFETIASQNATASLVPVSGVTNAANGSGSMQLWAGDSAVAMRSQQLHMEQEQEATAHASNSSSAIEVDSTTNHQDLTSVDRQASQGNANLDYFADQIRRAIIEAQVHRALPGRTQPACYEATAATQRRRGCTGYQECGYVCTTESCAAMSTECNGRTPAGRPCSCESCAVLGPAGSVVDPRTGRCRTRSAGSPPTENTSGSANGQPAVNSNVAVPSDLQPSQPVGRVERIEREVPGRV